MLSRQTIDPLGEFELLVLLCVRADRGEAHGSGIQFDLAIQARQEVALGTIAKTLRRLEAKGLVRSRRGDPRRRPGGRRRVLYGITSAGEQALERTMRGIANLGGPIIARIAATGGTGRFAKDRGIWRRG
jgi:DNA-binding PadR family transcriptional regulator